ncbi:sensor histidine kinase [Streptomyces griseocarneus]|uniref:sensor histidine kinase n=1 Tax=Streptomyces griseocarneus TaxID=51201 RepID=UPI0019CF10BC|nr:histidine kinase [Streptomyces griseocarneus]MBZ6473173.1 histidine kinase [Streptomyces griseocarneus]GHG60239.1 two-component sensor histidine kinase [Streptomyces griseocarneus]
MLTLIRPLLRADTYRGWLYALLGAATGLLTLPVATLLTAATPRDWPQPVRTTVLLAAWAALTAAAGCPRPARRASVRLANRLLGTALPAPAPAAEHARVPHRARTAAWLVLHTLAGWVTAVVTAFALVAAVPLVAIWLKGGERITMLVPVDVPGGPAGAWTLPVAAALLALACYAAAATTALLRRLAPALLGHRPAERLAALETQMRHLTQRNRLAQELHDSIGHTLTASTIQAAVARELMDTDPAAARRALTGLEEASRAAMDDLDHVLGILRQERAATAPPYALTDLPALVDRVRHAGADVRADISGDLAAVPATVSREAYRIVQEGLTNVLRHGDRSRIGLRVTVTAARLELEIANAVTARARIARRSRRGQGVDGVVERVQLLRGEAFAGPDPEGTGWLLTARIPLRSAA